VITSIVNEENGDKTTLGFGEKDDWSEWMKLIKLFK
jgi:hypothetical protein